MKMSYKSYAKQYIGESDIASLILVGIKDDEGLKLDELHFGCDGEYEAYIVDDNAIIGEHYHKMAEFDAWLRIYDDCCMVAKFEGEKINIYRAGDFGCIVQVIKEV